MIVVIGAGPIGTHIAEQYTAAGTPVRVLTRSGSGLAHPLVRRVRVDVTDRSALQAALEGARVVHDCMHASVYHESTWEAELPGAEQAVLTVAADVGAAVVFPESLYAFEPAPGEAITERTPTSRTAGMGGVRRRLLEARAAAPAATISVAASDYLGPGAADRAVAGDRMVGPAVRGTTAWTIGRTDQPHSWTYLPDLAAAMIAAAELPNEPDRLLLAPTNEPRTQQELADGYARAAGREGARLRRYPRWLMAALGRFDRGTAGLASMVHLFEAPLVMDSSASETLLGVAPTPWETVLEETVVAFG
ncbi:NAD-dependent epimerase/dehydratase family protein [Nocardioides acrostichi]|uniref:NAD-dependent epimerase/dehydratase family protein n=1 Tax=Nocardioides acrostichi TaxID=2784339 RepID=A0A930UYF6_9ACTN|nr:NAD-dependent epimerase/dehydratase family protein [Nocardioides acrostichi]MBF4161365.1 NAD-dependent epimerase/dehydratase family protein [Nocardioides acrostichi]